MKTLTTTIAHFSQTDIIPSTYARSDEIGSLRNIASLDTLLASINAEKIGRDIADTLLKQLSENEERLNKIREFKAGLYENLVSGNLIKDEYKSRDCDGLFLEREQATESSCVRELIIQGIWLQ